MTAGDTHYDWIVVGSGFGGSVSALRLSEKGYRVLVVERGRRWKPEDFPQTNWNLRRWLWLPELNFRGIQKLSFLRHITILSGVGVGGGSLVYANTLPVPKSEFFEIGTWAGIREWEVELGPHYATAQRMLGAVPTRFKGYGDDVLEEIAADLGRSEHYHPTDVAVYFGESGETAPDPFFDGAGPERTGCTLCGSCMTGCRDGGKNTLDKNYLYLAEQLGCEVLPDTLVTALRPLAEGGYEVQAATSTGWLGRKKRAFTADRVVMAGGVLGTIDLLLKMKRDPEGLPGLSEHTGGFIRTNSEALLYMVSERRDQDHSKGVAIGSILHTDEHSHVEPVRYGDGSGFYRVMLLPHAPGNNFVSRLGGFFLDLVRRPLRALKFLTNPNLAKFSTVLLYMRTLDGTLRFRRGWSWVQPFGPKLLTSLEDGSPPPLSYMPEATDIAHRFGEKTESLASNAFTETLMGIPTTAHILGGACIGKDWQSGVIDHTHQVFGYPGLYVIDGSAVSANPGVNPSLTITAMAERAMSLVAPKNATETPTHIGVAS